MAQSEVMEPFDPTARTRPALVATLGGTPFVDLVTYRASGEPVHTPVWVSTDGRLLYVSTFGDSYKVARVRREPRVAVAACTGEGTLLPGAGYVPGRATVVDRAGLRVGVQAHRAKYGTHFSLMWPARHVFRVFGHPRVWIVVDLDPGLRLPSDPRATH